jgi:hypothetical protein
MAALVAVKEAIWTSLQWEGATMVRVGVVERGR